jgi:hypothetical protein
MDRLGKTKEEPHRRRGVRPGQRSSECHVELRPAPLPDSARHVSTLKGSSKIVITSAVAELKPQVA